MAQIPFRLNKNSSKELEVTVVVFVDGREYVQTTQRVEEWAIPYVAAAACTQAEDPDYDAARDDLA